MRVTKLSPFVLHRAYHTLAARTHAPGLHHKLPDFVMQQPLLIATTRLRHLRHNRPDPRTHLQKPFLNQVLDDLMRGIGMNLQLGGQRPHRGKRLSRQEFTADERLGRGEYHLIEDRLTRTKGDFQACHISTVTEGTGPVNSYYGRVEP